MTEAKRGQGVPEFLTFDQKLSKAKDLIGSMDWGDGDGLKMTYTTTIAIDLMFGVDRNIPLDRKRVGQLMSLAGFYPDPKNDAEKLINKTAVKLLGRGFYAAMYVMDPKLYEAMSNARDASEVERYMPSPLKPIFGMSSAVFELIESRRTGEMLTKPEPKVEPKRSTGYSFSRNEIIQDESIRGTSPDLGSKPESKSKPAPPRPQAPTVPTEAGGGGKKERQGVVDSESEVIKQLKVEIERLKRRVQMAGINTGQGQEGSINTAEAYEALAQVPELRVATKEAVFNWTAQAVDWLGREPLFFAGAGWQQFGPYMEREVRRVFKAARKSEIDTLEAVEAVRTVLAPRLYEEALMHCDGALGILVKTLPQAGICDVYEWNSARVEKLLGDEMVSYFLEEVYNLVESDPKENLKTLASSEMANVMAENLVDLLLSDKDKVAGLERNGITKDKVLLQSLARVSVSIFLTDRLPDVIMWMNANSDKPGFENLVEKIKNNRKLNSERMVGDVVVYDTMLNKNLGFSHPFVGLRRPVDIYRANNVWNEIILGEAEKALRFLGEKVFIKKDGDDKRFKRWSEIGLKTLDRWDAMMSAFFGGTQAENLDNFNDLDKGLDKLQKIIQNDADMSDIGGVVAAKMIKVKVMALLAENRSGFSGNIMRALSIERSSVPKELSDALGRMAGSGLDTSFGSIKEAVSRLGFNFIECVDLQQAVDMLVTETSDPLKAKDNLRTKKAAMFLKAALDLASESKNGGGKKK